MIEVRQEIDRDYFRAILSLGRFRRAVPVGHEPSHALLEDDRTVYHVVYDGARRLGFIAYEFISPLVRAIHLCLLTLGRRTREAVTKSMLLLRRSIGTNINIFASIDSTRRDLVKLADALGFVFEQRLQPPMIIIGKEL